MPAKARRSPKGSFGVRKPFPSSAWAPAEKRSRFIPTDLRRRALNAEKREFAQRGLEPAKLSYARNRRRPARRNELLGRPRISMPRRHSGRVRKELSVSVRCPKGKPTRAGAYATPCSRTGGLEPMHSLAASQASRRERRKRIEDIAERHEPAAQPGPWVGVRASAHTGERRQTH